MEYINNPLAIERLSYEIITAQTGEIPLGKDEWTITRRIIHATGDLEYGKLVVVHPNFVTAASTALRRGADIFTDVEMVRQGINNSLLNRNGCRAICAIRSEEVTKRAVATGETRAMVAMEHLSGDMKGNLVAIGNAPTALFKLLELIAKGKAAPAAVIGTPVGFVGAAEAKAALECAGIPFVTVRGTKGGSAVAAAAVNALLNLVWNREDR